MPVHVLLPAMLVHVHMRLHALCLTNSNPFGSSFAVTFPAPSLNQVGCPVPAPTTPSAAPVVAQTRNVSQIHSPECPWMIIGL